MALTPGTKLGFYEVVSALGAGGMGEVYRAQDTKLGRHVAIKVLPAELAADLDRIARFEREAKMLASLNHPHIAALYGLDQSAGRHFLVMELVEGETLAERLARGSLQVAGALTIATQIVEALEAAHERGIVHRDLKPANIKITPDGNVKVLDFGLAKAVGGEPGAGANLSQSPTLSRMATEAGMILGTAAYMSPEQAQGLQVDHRSDVFSFGAVLFEMLTGRQAFNGDTAAAILASVLAREPDLTLLPAHLNPRLTDLLRRCLDKHPKKRWQAVGDLRAEIEVVAAAPYAPPAAVAVAMPLWTRGMPVAAAVVLTAGVTGAVAWRLRTPAAAPPVVARFSFALPDGQRFTSTQRRLVAVSPDGTQMIYSANNRLNLRTLSELNARPIAGTEISTFTGDPAFSPDGRSLAFFSFSEQALKRIAIGGGAAVVICSSSPPFGVSWSGETIVFGQPQGIMRVPATGGTPELVVSVKAGELAHGPQILPGGEALLFTLASGTNTDRWDKAKVVVQSLKSGARTIVMEGGSDAHYVPTGHLVYAVEGVLYAARFDLARLRIIGGAVPVVEGVQRTTGGANGGAQFSASDTGTLAYVPGPAAVSSAGTDLVLVDRMGVATPLKLPPRAYEFPRVSPDGTRIAVGSDDGKEANIWLYDLSGTTSPRRLTSAGKNRFPIWSADGAHVAFQSDRDGDFAVFWQRADGTGAAERLTRPDKDTAHIPETWSPDGKVFLFGVSKGSSNELWQFSLEDRKASPFGGVRSALSVPTSAAFSPDGRWVAYTSNDAPSLSVFAQPFPATGTASLVAGPPLSAGLPFWSPDGKELFFHDSTPNQWVAMRITTRPALGFGTPVPLITLQPYRFRGFTLEREVDITPNGRSFVAVAVAAVADTQRIDVVLNWFEELKQRAP